MKIDFPDSFPDISEEKLCQTFSEFEREHGIKEYGNDNKKRFGRTHAGYFTEESVEQFDNRFRKAQKNYDEAIRKFHQRRRSKS